MLDSVREGVFRLYRPKAYTIASTAMPAIAHPIPIPTLAPVLRPDDEVAFDVGSAVVSVELDKEFMGVVVAPEGAEVVEERAEVEEVDDKPELDEAELDRLELDEVELELGKLELDELELDEVELELELGMDGLGLDELELSGAGGSSMRNPAEYI